MKLLENFLSQKPDGPIFHYTDSRAAIGILQTKKIWASTINHLNDQSEYKIAAEWLLEELSRRDQKRVVEMLHTGTVDKEAGRTGFGMAMNPSQVFVTSFSESEDLLSQWRAYSPLGDGFSLGFDASSYANAPVTHMSLIKCVYTEKRT